MGNEAATQAPAEFVTRCRVSPLAGFCTVTLAPGITAPDVSVTVPTILASWPKPVRTTPRETTVRNRNNLFIIHLLQEFLLSFIRRKAHFSPRSKPETRHGQSKGQPQSELNEARVVCLVGNLSKLWAIIHAIIWEIELWTIEKVEGFDPELEAQLSFRSERGGFKQRKVPIVNSVCPHVRQISAHIAKGERRRVHKTGGVKPLVQSAFRRSAERRTVRARGGVKVGPERACKGVGQIIADIHMDWKAALERCNSIHTPSGNQLPGYSMNTLEISFPLAKWEVEHVAQDQALRYVEG